MTRKSLRRVVTAGLAFTGLLAVSGIASAAGDAAKGEQLYASQKCSMCHSIAGKGNKKYPLDGVGGKLSAADLHEWLVNPDAQAAKKGESTIDCRARRESNVMLGFDLREVKATRNR